MSNVQTLQQPVIDFYEIEEVAASVIFPEVYAQGEGPKVKRRKHRHPDCVSSNPDYIPCERILKRALAWWFSPMRQAFGLTGETGTGKTELLQYIADKLNEPFYLISVHPQLTPEELEGSKDLVSTPEGVITRPTPGLAAKAYRLGGLLVLDEVDKASAPLGCALHGLVEGKPWSIPQFSLTINRHSMCRIAVTGNTTGEGGHDRYHTSNRMDQALRSRIGWMKTHYPRPDREMKILEKKFPMLPRKMVKEMVLLANAFRDALLGPVDATTGIRPGNVENPINAVFSTRTLVNWASYTIAFGKDAIWRESLDFAFGGSIDSECADEGESIIQRVLDAYINLPVGDVVAMYSGTAVSGSVAGKP